MLSDVVARAYSLAARSAVVTGAASGIGQQIALTFALSGAHVTAIDVNQAGLERTLEMIRSHGGFGDIRRVDVSEQAAIDRVAREVFESIGRLDIWVNCAGISFVHQILETKFEEFERTVAVNMGGPLWGCMAAGRIMKEQGRGSIINISSEGGSRGVPGLSVYGMTKSTVNSLTRTAAREFGTFGVRVNAIAPGWVDTPIAEVLYKDEHGNIDPVRRQHLLDQMVQQSSLGLVGHPSDVAYAAHYLASDASRFVTGQILTVNGGEVS